MLSFKMVVCPLFEYSIQLPPHKMQFTGATEAQKDVKYKRSQTSNITSDWRKTRASKWAHVREAE